MNTLNKYCCQCHRTTGFQVQDRSYTCSRCGTVVTLQEKEDPPAERGLIGDPMRSYKTHFAA